MFALIKYADNYMEICTKRQITKIYGDECTIKHKGCSYEGTIVATSGKYPCDIAKSSFALIKQFSFLVCCII